MIQWKIERRSSWQEKCIVDQSMRIPRSIQLSYESGFVHKFWRCHNKEFYLRDDKIKDLYLNCTIETLKDKSLTRNIRVHSFCVMDNHFHEVSGYENGSTNYSEYMRKSHSSFGAKYNKLKNRSGKVAEGRPKTPLIENFDHLARVQMYVEANPLRAGKVDFGRLKTYRFSTYQFYAYGIKGPYHALITEPDWYIDLGDTPKERQREYRRLFQIYLEENKSGLANFLKYFIGSPGWIVTETRRANADATLDLSKESAFDSG